MKKEHPTVMLPAKKADKGMIALTPDKVLALLDNGTSTMINNGKSQMIPQHLYILSQEEIKEGDWVYRSDNKDIFKAGSVITSAYIESPNLMGAEGVQKKYCSKVIATTNPELTQPEAKVTCPRCKSTLEVHLPDHLKCSNKECEWTVWNIVNGIYNDVKPSSVAKIADDFLPIYVEVYNAGKPIEMVELEYEQVLYNETDWKLSLSRDNTVNISLKEERMFTEENMIEAYRAGVNSDFYDCSLRMEVIAGAKQWLSKHYPS